VGAHHEVVACMAFWCARPAADCMPRAGWRQQLEELIRGCPVARLPTQIAKHAHAHAQARAHVHACMRTRARMCALTHARTRAHTHTHTYTHTQIHTPRPPPGTCLRLTSTCCARAAPACCWPSPALGIPLDAAGAAPDRRSSKQGKGAGLVLLADSAVVGCVYRRLSERVWLRVHPSISWFGWRAEV
jgi:hypothetical protein